MEERFIQWTQKDVDFKTNMNKRKYDHVKDSIQHYETDDKQDSRINNHRCKCCYYIRNICGFSAITTSYCGICKDPILNGSSDTDKICVMCAEINNLCTRCGGEMD